MSNPTPSSEGPSAEVWREGLECVIGKAKLLVPSELVEAIIELELSPPPPLTRKWVGGLGMSEQRAAICVSLVPLTAAQRAAPRRTIQAILFRVEDSEVAWVLEIKQVKTFVKVQMVSPKDSPPATSTLPGWIAAAVAADGQALGWIDVEAMVRELAGTA